MSGEKTDEEITVEAAAAELLNAVMNVSQITAADAEVAETAMTAVKTAPAIMATGNTKTIPDTAIDTTTAVDVKAKTENAEKTVLTTGTVAAKIPNVTPKNVKTEIPPANPVQTMSE